MIKSTLTWLPVLLLLLLGSCRTEVREVRPVGTSVIDDSRKLPDWLLPGNLAVIDLCRETALTEQEIRDQLMEIKYAGFKGVLILGAQPTHSTDRDQSPHLRPVLTNLFMTAPLETEEIWKRTTDFAHQLGLVVIRDAQSIRHARTHEHFVTKPERFILPDTAKSYTGPVFMRQNEPAWRDSIEDRLVNQLIRTGCDGVLCYAPDFYSETFASRLEKVKKSAIGFQSPVPSSDLILADTDYDWTDFKNAGPEALRIWLCGLPDESPSRTAERFMLPGPAAVYWVNGASADRLSFLASFNRMESEVQALNNGRMGGMPTMVTTDRDSCITAFKRTAGESGAIFLLNRCDFTVDFKILSPIGGMYHNTADYRLLSDFSPNRVVLQAGRYTIFVRQSQSAAE